MTTGHSGSAAARLIFLAVAGTLAAGTSVAQAQQADQTPQASAPTQLPEVSVSASPSPVGYAAQPQFHTDKADLGPLGTQSIQDIPANVTTVPEDLITNTMSRGVNDALRYLPSVQIRDQQGYEVSRPQARGFQGSVVQNTRMDGLTVIGTTAIPAESLQGIQVLNGLGGSLFGPETPAGVFNYVLKRPTDQPLYRYIQGFDSNSVFTEQGDVSGHLGSNNQLGYRFNVLHGQGEGYASGSDVNRTMVSANFDLKLGDNTVVEADAMHYSTNTQGLPGSVVYYGASSKSGTNTILPKAFDPTKAGLSLEGAGADLITDTGLLKIKHRINDDWSFEAGGLYQDAQRNLWGITNTFIDNNGHFTVTKNFTAWPHATIGSNTASLNGHVDILGMKNDVSFGTNGFINSTYSYRNNITVNLPGTWSLANPPFFTSIPATPNPGSEYKSAELSQQTIVVGDTLHFTDHWAVQAVLNTSFLSSSAWNSSDKLTSSDSDSGELSPSVALIWTPTQRWTVYANYANAVEQGEQAAASNANANQYLSPYRDHQYEVGAKYALTKTFMVTLDAFHMTRPLASTNVTTNVFEVVGRQRNNGVELFLQGDPTSDVSLLGGVTYIDARLFDTGNPATEGNYVVGVPNVKSDFAVDYHPAFARGGALTGAVHVEGERAATNISNSYAPSFATLDLGARYSTAIQGHHATARLQVINVTNQVYYSSIADGNIVGSPGANTAYLGTPRTFLANLELDF